MTVASLSPENFNSLIGGQGLVLKIGPFVAAIRSSIPSIKHCIKLLYADYPVLEQDNFVDFHLRLAPPKGLRRWYRPQVIFHFDDRVPFKPLPYSQAFPFFEWGLNWCVANHINQYLILHSAVVEKNGKAAILPGPPGAGKSTLCAALVTRGWRLLSDEMALVSPRTGRIESVPRPVSLKNESIDIIKRFAPDAVIGPNAEDTTKGTVAHMKPPAESIIRAGESAQPVWIIIPDYQAGVETQVKEKPKTELFMHVVQNAFNYSILGELGFNVLGNLIDDCECLTLVYSDLDDAIAVFDQLADSDSVTQKSNSQ